MSHGFGRFFGLCSLTLLWACTEEPTRSRGAPEEVVGHPPSCADDSPLPVGFEHPTTSAEIALGNLTAQIESLTRLVERSPSDVAFRQSLIGALLSRVQFTGRFSDFTRAEEAASLPASAESAAALSLGATVAGATHDFAGALDALDRATTLDGVSRDDDRAPLLVALGRDLETALAGAEDRAARWPSFETWSAVAAARAAVGRHDDADAAYLSALAAYRETSPLPVAWVAFQRGVLWAEMAGCKERARPLYEEAVAHLPDYVVASVHLAELEMASGHTAAAEARLARVTAFTEDPEAFGALSGLLAETDAARASALAAEGTERYDRLLAGPHRAAFLDHGAEFFAGPGRDPERALSLAEANLVLRPTPRAHLVALRAAQAAGDTRRACALASAAAGTHVVPLAALAAEVQAVCR